MLKFHELFAIHQSATKPTNHAYLKPNMDIAKAEPKGSFATISTLCMVQNQGERRNIFVKPLGRVMNFIRQNMSYSELDKVFFTIIINGPEANVYATWTRLVGNKLIATINSEEVPS